MSHDQREWITWSQSQSQSQGHQHQHDDGF